MFFIFSLLVLLAPAPSPKSAVSSQLTHCELHLNAASAAEISLRNSQLVTCEGGSVVYAQRLHNGRGSSQERLPDTTLKIGTDAGLKWTYVVDSDHLIAAHWWVWTAASSSSSEYVQVIERQQDKWVVVQQIEMDIHHGGKPVGASYERKTKTLTCKAVNYAGGEGRCCPSLMDVVTFHWDGARFRRIAAKKVDLPPDR